MADKYHVIYDKASNTHCVYKDKRGDWYGLLIAEYVDKFAAEFVCEMLNQNEVLEAKK